MTFGAILMAAAVAAAAQPSPRPVAAVGDAAMTCRAGRVQSLAVGADLLINVELDDKSNRSCSRISDRSAA